MDPLFLMEQMELREALADVKTSSEPFTELNVIMQTIENMQSKMLQEYVACVTKGDFEQAKALVYKLHFMDKLKIESEILEEELAEAI